MAERVKIGVAWLLVAPAAVWCVLRVIGWDNFFPMTQLMAFTPYVAVAALLPVLLVLLLKQWRAAAVGAVAALLLLLAVVPRWLTDSAPLADAKGPALRVLTANLLVGSADPQALVRLVGEQRVDVVALQELTPGFVSKVEAAGITKVLPYKVVYPEPGVGGSGFYSRYPLVDAGYRKQPLGFGQAKAELSLPDRRSLLLESAHPVAPSEANRIAGWRESFGNEPPATPDGPVRVLLGDFNATLDHAPLRKLINTGYRDAAEVMGQGLAGTWGPYDGDDIPPVVIDHVLADRRVGVREVEVFPVAGSDHRAVLAELVLP